MYFLVAYDRSKAKLVEYRKFSDDARGSAFREKLQLDDHYASRADVEVGVFQSRDESTFMKTHARYFFSASDLVDRLGKLAEGMTRP